MLKFYTKAWLDEIALRLKADLGFAQEGKKLHGTFAFRVYDGPDKQDRQTFWTFKMGQAIDYKYEAHPSPWEELRQSPYSANWVMRVSAPFNIMAKVNKGEITPTRALSSPEYNVEGSKTLIMVMMRSINIWNEITAKIEVSYEFEDDK